MNEQTDATLAAVGKGATYLGSGAAFLGGLSANDIAALAGIVGLVVGLLMQWYFGWRKDARESAEHRARMEAYRHDD
jgi:membrane associated rhomboid family serine protease